MELGRTIKLWLLLASVLLSVQAFGIEPQILTGVLNAQNPAFGAGWTELQNIYSLPCGASLGFTTCTTTVSANYSLFTMTPGTDRFIWQLNDDGHAGAHISTAYDCTGASPCTSGNANNTYSCTTKNNAGNDNVSVCYALNATGSPNGYTVNMSAACGTSYCATYFLELQHQSGFTSFIDAGPTSYIDGSCTSCATTSLINTGTDADLQFADTFPGGGDPLALGWPYPYIMDVTTAGIFLNAPVGTTAAPAFNNSGGAAGYFTGIGIAVGSTAGNYSAPLAPFKLNAVSQLSNVGVACNPTCTLTLSATTVTGDLLELGIATTNGATLSSAVTKNGASTVDTFTVPAASGNTACAHTGASGGETVGLSCGYVLASTSGATTVSITMGSNSTIGAVLYDVSRSSGTFALDTQGSQTNAAATQPLGVALTLTGPDVLFALFGVNGGGCGQSLVVDNANFYTLNNQINQGLLLNTANGSAETICNPQNIASVSSKIAFK